MGFTINAEGTQRIVAVVITVFTTIIIEIILIRGLKEFSIIVERKSTEKMKKERYRNILSIVFITLAISLGILSYTLCYASIMLYNMNYKEEFAGMAIGAIFMGMIIGLFYMVLITWKEFKETGIIKTWKQRK